ncbi:protein translocase subunit SecD [Formicincola oecophyllae]|uniref:Protein translocase subunit SecD n=1 Tax=Formicincola oecophyllae TaxID=2558361 RepID=A0A4Y6UD49_9PROT|nr:protein translocase subunit SecD [Formicincola oecophyllae]QDH14508.1 protein translocase subunit SecD [Formicincola oecophyllae]
MYYSRLRMLGTAALCLISVLLCVPNFLPAPSKAWPWHQVHLGLDLRGGSFLLLQLDTKVLEHDKLAILEGQVKHALQAGGAGYVDMKVDQAAAAVSFAPRAPSELSKALAIIKALPEPTPGAYHSAVVGGRIVLAINRDTLKAVEREAITRSIEIVRRRIDSTGAMDPTIAREGDDRIMVELPGVSDPAHIEKLLGTTARMTFHLLAPDPSVATPGATMMTDEHGRKLAVLNQIEVDGADLSDASAGMSDNRWAVHLNFDAKGAEEFGRITTANVGKPFAIVLDGRILTAPVINTPITGGQGEITGNFTAQSATDLAVMLRAGALPAPLVIVEQNSIGPSLGEASIKAGLISLAVGFVLVVGFMLLFYGLFGLYADIALLANLVMILAVLSLFEATITLPGMAGILLTLGMAVDANILINERVREEQNRGLKPLQALQVGFEKATGTIVDSNATAFLAHVMLFVFGTGPVRNFALTITIGIGTTLFTTLVLTRLLIVRWYAHTRPKELPV